MTAPTDTMMAIDPQLLPCPLCGSTHVSLSAWDVQCDDCGALVAPAEGARHEAGAIEAWNRRTPATVSSGPVAVKALQWHEPQFPEDGERRMGIGAMIAYWADQLSSCEWSVTMGYWGGAAGPQALGPFATLDAAKAAAQADYEQRIRSALA